MIEKMMKQLKITTNTTTKVTLNGIDANDVIRKATDLAHEVLEELSIYRQRHNLPLDTFSCEGSCCKFLDIIGD